MFKKGDFIRAVVQPMRFEPYEQLVVLIQCGDIHQEKVHRAHGNKYIMVTKIENYQKYRRYSPDLLYNLWREGKSEVNPIFLFDYHKFKLWTGKNSDIARHSLEVFE